MKKSYNSAHSRSEPVREPVPDKTVSSIELYQLEGLRRRPHPEQTLKPPGGPTFMMLVDRTREARIEHIRSRFAETKGQAKEEFSQVKAHGKAKADFDRSR